MPANVCCKLGIQSMLKHPAYSNATLILRSQFPLALNPKPCLSILTRNKTDASRLSPRAKDTRLKASAIRIRTPWNKTQAKSNPIKHPLNDAHRIVEDKTTLIPSPRSINAKNATFLSDMDAIEPIGEEDRDIVDTTKHESDRRTEMQLITKKKNKLHKLIWNSLKSQQWMSWERYIEEFRAAQLPLDEVSFTLLVHGYILSRKHSKEEAWNILQEMKHAQVHPILVRYTESLLTSYFELSSHGAPPHDFNWRKVLRASWLIAALVKGRRQRHIERLNISLLKEGISENILPSIHDLKALWYGDKDPLLCEDLIKQMDCDKNNVDFNYSTKMSKSRDKISEFS